MERHPNATTHVRTRAALVRRVLEQNWSIAKTAAAYGTSPATVKKWVARFQREGAAGLADRSSRPATSPTRTPAHVARRVGSLRRKRGLSVQQIAEELSLSAATVSRILKQLGLASR